jgi:hypothetical protein
MDLSNEYLIGIDIDWASDPMIAETSGILIKEGIKATWFVSHQSREIQSLGRCPELFEMGVHPNFSKDSTQGRTPAEIMSCLMNIVPEARSARTHLLLQSTPLLKLMREEYGIHYDASLHLPGTPHIVPHELYLGKNNQMIRVPTFWEDSLELIKPSPCLRFMDKRYHLPGIKIFIFHPVHIMLNSRNYDDYSHLKESQRITDCTIDDVRPYINKKETGIKSLFYEFIDFIKKESSLKRFTLSELANSWSKDKDRNDH